MVRVGTLALLLILEKSFHLWSSMTLIVDLSYMTFIMLRYVPFKPTLLKFLSWKNVEFCQMFFLHLNYQIAKNLVGKNNTDLLFYSYGGQKSEMSQQGCVSPGGSRKESVLAFSSFYRLLAFLGQWPCMSLTSASIITSPSLTLTLLSPLYMGPCDYTGSPG